MTSRCNKKAYPLLVVSIVLLVIFHLRMLSEPETTAVARDPSAESKNLLTEKNLAKSMTNLADSMGALDSVNAVSYVIDTKISLTPSSTLNEPNDPSQEYKKLQNNITDVSELTRQSVLLQEVKTARPSIQQLFATKPAINTDTRSPSEFLEDAIPGRHSQHRVAGVRTTMASNAVDLEIPEAAYKNIISGNDPADIESESLRASRRRHVVTDLGLYMSSSDGLVNVVSMSLYGSDPRYVIGAIRNAQLIRQNFPGWQLWIYMESSESSRYPPVPSDVIARLVEIGADVHYITPQDDFVPPMMWRFMVADDPSVDRFIVRDADSRLTRRDSASVAAWIKSGQPFYCVRDHPSHAGYAVSGGLWGGRAPALRILMRRSWASLMRGVADGYLNDMNFLNNVVWPRVAKVAFCTDSVSCDRWTGAVPFPVVRQGYEHIGQVYDENDSARRIDVKIFERTGENRNCIPNE